MPKNSKKTTRAAPQRPRPDSDGLEDLLEFLKTTRGFDFTGYKRTTLGRRIQRRMQDIGANSFAGYRDYLQAHPGELTPLFNTILINVTSFFRDKEAWDYLAAEVVPRILGSKGPEETVRVWSVGCASGQEPYSVAMLLAEAMGIERLGQRVKVYATDLDDNALEQARAARYTAPDLEGVPEPMRAKYFQGDDKRFTFHPVLRRVVIFGRHDLMEDAPIPHLDLAVCRNTLMYFNADAQSRIVERLHFALEPDGFLFLGRAEMLLSHGDLFAPLELKHRIFTRVASPQGRYLTRVPRPAGLENRRLHPQFLCDAAIDAAPVAVMVLDAEGRLALCNHQAQRLFPIGRQDLGKPLQDLEVSYRPLELRSLIDEARQSRQPVTRAGVEHRPESGEECYLDIQVVPLYRDEVYLGISVSFDDVTRHQRLEGNLHRFAANLETAYEELQSANEELETTNEELQSANEELESTNEELQSANEEMETMNEELRSTNDELSSANEELRRRESQLQQANSFLRSVLEGIEAAVVVLDEHMRVVVWNERAAEMWGLRSDEVEGRPFLALDIGLPVKELTEPLRSCVGPNGSRQTVVLKGHNRRGRAMTCRVNVNPLAADHLPGHRAILLMQEVS